MARRASRLSQAELARRGGTSQATISAYERGLKTPSLDVAARLLGVLGYELTLHSRIDFEEYHPEGIGPFWAPNLLWRVPTPDCFDTLRIPDLLQYTPQGEWNLKDRTDRRRAYEILIREGTPQQMIRWLDGALLIDLWDELDLPDPIRWTWLPAVATAREARIGVDALSGVPHAAPYAKVRGYDPVPSPPPPPPPPRRQRRSRFDPRNRPDTRSVKVAFLLRQITIDPMVGHNCPAIRDTGIRVTHVLTQLAEGADEARILEDHPDLTAEDIKACLMYAATKVDPSIDPTL